MIVSSLVVTSKGPLEHLLRKLSSDPRLEVGTPNKGFVPVVSTTTSLSDARELYEQLSAHEAVMDVQLVGWADEELYFEEPSDAVEPKESP